ncbi:FtsX-like permease family protein [Actinomadura sp. LD22]|uniref:FtsX-like permease family protein n=1 Tax=Actinomadura physcomitrii TaxID=2650748 RepID=A0A6I4M810_9ACTN|nr:FtsX-like permease family protein [Actinomadura physcomitrii]MWA00505.1 FtsX-like permease family protein [Actinomadura physcomitrii]
MSVLTVKLRRDLRRRPAQLVSVVVLVMLGVALFGASYDAYRNLDSGYQRLFERYRFADLTLSGGDTAAIAAAAAAEPGVAATAARTVADVPMRMPDGGTFVGRVIGMPAGSQPAVDKVQVLRGRYLDASAPAGVLAEKHVADHARLRPGARVAVWHGGAWQPLEVRGTASSTEYLWPAASRQDALPAPGSFGVLFVAEPLAERIAGTSAPNQVAVYYTAAGRRHTGWLDAALTAAARRHGAGAAVTRADQPGNATLAEDIKGFAELAVLFPLLFLAAAGVAVYVVLARRVARDRVVIGTLRASGFRRRTLVGHYLATGLAAGLAGAVPGAAAGVLLAGTVTRLYGEAIGLPETFVSVRAATVAAGLGYGLAAGALAALAPALSAARVPPAEAMRGIVPSAGGRGALARLGRLGRIGRLRRVGRAVPAGAWLVLRGPSRQFRRTVYTMSGVVLALVLILVSWGMLDSSKATVSRQFDQVQRQDAELTLAGPAGPAALAALATVPGIRAAEPSAQVQATVTAGGKAYSTALVGYRPGTAMHRFLTPGGGARALPARGVLLGRAMRGRLGVTAGDRVTLRLPGGRTAATTVAGFVDEPLGTYAYTSLAQVDAWAPAGGAQGSSGRRDTALVRFAPGADRAAAEHALSARPGVVACTDAHALRRTMDGYMKLFYVFVAVMLAFGGLLAFTVLFATLSVNLAERGTELATLRASGVGRRRLARLVTTENLLAVAVGAVPGLILGRLATGAFLGAFNSDLMAFHTDIRPATLAWSALAVLAVAFLAQRPGLRALARQNLGALVRERSG